MTNTSKNMENSSSFHVSLIGLFIKGNRNVDVEDILKHTDLIENPPEYDVDKVIDSM
jgi:hypothetical protein